MSRRCLRSGTVFAAAMLVLSQPAHADEVLWPSEVRRVDPSSQDYERLPPRPPTASPNARPAGSFRIRGFFRVRDSVSFTYNKKNYRLAGADPVANSKICLDRQGRRWGCGIIARTTFEELLSSAKVFCLPVEEADDWTAVKCGSETLDIATEMIARGFAVVAKS
ncbi:hypothetical protein [Hoeflea ulvae]|uniref:Thermonuclease family protein n=1 Tax=Hoeflea ulvae TaxID=2983764 RepID=A0ABT3YKS8_9HYPH|nr:hypothetical protein [Hoeflea ulvae]MCY0096374.1 hypothetical protein [Hoeflea ulvae]